LADVNEFTSAYGVKMYFSVRRRDRAGHIGDTTTEIAQHTRFETTQGEVRTHDMTILLGYSVLAVVLLIAIYFGAMSSGMAPGDLASMTVFP
jgi:hypothetical protein